MTLSLIIFWLNFWSERVKSLALSLSNTPFHPGPCGAQTGIWGPWGLPPHWRPLQGTGLVSSPPSSSNCAHGETQDTPGVPATTERFSGLIGRRMERERGKKGNLKEKAHTKWAGIRDRSRDYRVTAGIMKKESRLRGGTEQWGF